MSVRELAGKSAPRLIVADIPRLISAYYTSQHERTIAEIRNHCQMINNI